ncbi:MAG: hypothetical protein JRF05_01220, partial [Deltaproteobacteria bacterium]|nr:hypothetical protein [Deltaproteobacteria bacterium]
MKRLLIVLIMLLGTALNVQAFDLQNKAALEGVTNSNAVFDISPGGERLLGQLNVIHKTYEQLVTFGQNPKFILAFRGGATKFVTTGDKYVSSKDLKIKNKIQQKIKDINELGAKMELCGIAA